MPVFESEFMRSLMEHLPVVVVITPLFGGLLTIFTGFIQRGGGLLAWLWALFITAAVLACSSLLLWQVQTSGGVPVVYRMGSWPEEYGIVYVVDALNAYVIFVVALLSFLSTLYAKRSIEAEIAHDRHHQFYAVWLLAIAGFVGISITGDAFNVYVLLEIASLTVYTLVAMGGERDRRALVAALKYVILGSIGATFILLGIGYMLMLTGTLNMADMHEQLVQMHARGELEGNRTVLVGFAFLIVGLALKMALWPLHLWLPNAYTYAPSAVSVLISATATKVGVYMTFRFVFTIWGGVYDTSEDMYFLSLLACAGILHSSVTAIHQWDAKRVLAFSSVGQLGYIVLGFSLVNEPGMISSVIHIFNHAIVKGGMFMALGAVCLRTGGTTVEHLQGLGRRMPLTMSAFTIGGFGLIGVPMTAGFISKWYLVEGAMEEGYWAIAFVVLLGGVLALVYMWRLIEIIWMKPPLLDAGKTYQEAPLTMLIPMWILIGLSVAFGIDATWTAESARAAAHVMLQGANP